MQFDIESDLGRVKTRAIRLERGQKETEVLIKAGDKRRNREK